MKKIIIALLVGIIVLSVSSCADKDMEYSYSIKDALKISAYLFDESVEGNVYNENDTVYTLTQLKLNEVAMMAPKSATDMMLLNIFLEFEGIIEVISEDEDIQLSRNNFLTPWYKGESDNAGRTYGYNIQFATEGYISASPLNEYINHGMTKVWHLGKVGREYYLSVNAYRFDNEKTPTIRAQLKLVVIEDKNYISNGFPEDSLCYSIELISYEYSDMAKLMDEIVDENDE